MNERWLRIDLLPKYEVSNTGRIRNAASHRIIKPGIHKQGYPRVSIERKNHLVHRLVAMAFIDNPLNKKYINHKNGVKNDNLVSNLEWCTPSENNRHAHRIGLNVHYQIGKSGKLHRASIPLISIQETAIIEHESRCLCAKYLNVTIGAVYTSLKKGYKCKGHNLYSL